MRRKFKKRVHKTKEELRNIYIISSVLVILLIVVCFSLFSSFFVIQKVEINGNHKIQNLEEYTDNYLGNGFLSKNILVLDKKKLKENILNNHILLNNIEVKKKLPNTLEINVSERPEYAVWCQKEQYEIVTEEETDYSQESYTTTSKHFAIKDVCFFSDDNGMIFQNSTSSDFVIYSQDINRKIGDFVIPKDLLDLIIKTRKEIKHKAEIDLVSAQIISDNQINFKTSEKWDIYINPKKEIEYQAKQLEYILNLKLPSEKREELEYVDLRFESISIYPNLLE